MELRLQSALAKAGFGSRRFCEKIILEKRVSVNGACIEKLGTKVVPHQDIVFVDGNEIVFQRKVYLALNKPKGYICTSNDTHDRLRAIDLVVSKSERLFTVGRLDKNTEGLIFLTNDGNFSNQVLHPANKIEKVYEALLNRKISDRDINSLRKGIDLGDFVTSPAKVIYLGKGLVEITISEGKKRQLRRMFLSLGYNVTKLTRVQIGAIKLGNLEKGKFRKLNRSEILSLTKGICR
ncbi:MAG: pseudouridine synthase [Candidatus Theseobacter exili]|nr:pseudouridine synthase [Candidatus Theseobacter exili]